MENEIKILGNRVDRVERTVENVCEKLQSQEIQSARIDEKLLSISTSVNSLVVAVGALNARPAAKWDKLSMAIIGSIGTGIVGVLIAILFK